MHQLTGVAGHFPLSLTTSQTVELFGPAEVKSLPAVHKSCSLCKLQHPLVITPLLAWLQLQDLVSV